MVPLADVRRGTQTLLAGGGSYDQLQQVVAQQGAALICWSLVQNKLFVSTPAFRDVENMTTYPF